ncbi:pyrophosphatase [Allorhizobium sp. BGMRC 0089]|uniref:MazG nucleotide pyrophosphohydrolase domain-containing protein n=1 Tax=Allorhizobium sonneratiae TaxID=2934936 RepID=UPI00203339E5|nr:MazG nucleotide pyrophosphohydrolase domain-containing protein [Allorhizobium sonneratiae]MCM2294503.1 pyrophosphatase [Allorhizobium sonneratiae]
MLDDLMEKFEAASARYAETHGLVRDRDWFLLKLAEEAGEVLQVANRLSGRSRSKGMTEAEIRSMLADETADLLGHVLLFARHHGLDLEAAIERKWRFKP